MWWKLSKFINLYNQHIWQQTLTRLSKEEKQNKTCFRNEITFAIYYLVYIILAQFKSKINAMVTRCCFPACGDPLWFLMVQHVFILCPRKKIALRRLITLRGMWPCLAERGGASLVVTEKCKAASRGKQIQEDAVPRISRPPQDTDHLTQMICQ